MTAGNTIIFFLLWSGVGFFVFMLIGSLTKGDQLEVNFGLNKKITLKSIVIFMWIFIGGPLVWVIGFNSEEEEK